MASLYKKVISGKPYWYLREMGWVDGKPKMISERYLGSAADIEALLDARESAALPERTRHLAFGDWWKTTAGDRFTKIPASVLGHRRFWAAMHAVTVEQLEQISHAIALRAVELSGADISSVALDMTNFATYIDTGNEKAPVAQRGKAKQKRSDLRLGGRARGAPGAGGFPLPWPPYPAAAPAPPSRGPAARRDDRGVRRRAELRGQLRLPRRDRPALRRIGSRFWLPGPDRTARLRAHRRRREPAWRP